MSVWHSLLSSLAGGDALDSNLTNSLLEAAHNGRLPQYLKPQEAELDGVVGNLLERALSGKKHLDEVSLFRRILVNSGWSLSFVFPFIFAIDIRLLEYFVSRLGYEKFLEIITSTFASNVQLLLEGKGSQISSLDVALHLVEAVFSSILQTENLMKSVVPVLFNLAYLVPLALPESASDVDITSSLATSKALWDSWLNKTPETKKQDIVQEVVRSLREFMMDPNIYPLQVYCLVILESTDDRKYRPTHILQLLYRHPPGIHVDLVEDVFPSRSQLDAMLEEFSPEPNDPSLAVLNDSLPTTPQHSSKNKVKKPIFADRHGFAPYARVVDGLAQAFVEDRQLSKRNLWAFRHLLALSIYAQDLMNVPSSYEYASPLFDGKISVTRLEEVMRRVKLVSVYLFNFLNSSGSSDDGAWRCGVVECFLQVDGKNASRGLIESQVFLFDILWHAKKKDTVRDARILKTVLRSLLADGVGESEADLWLQLARRLDKTGVPHILLGEYGALITLI